MADGVWCGVVGGGEGEGEGLLTWVGQLSGTHLLEMNPISDHNIPLVSLSYTRLQTSQHG